MSVIRSNAEEKQCDNSNAAKRTGNKTKIKVVPLQIFISVQSGRRYLMAYSRQFKRITSFRLDHMLSVKIEKEDQDFEELRKNWNI